MSKFFLSHQGQQLGPWSREEIETKLKAKALDWTDYIFNEANGDWIMLIDFPPFSELINHEIKLQSPPVIKTTKEQFSAPEVSMTNIKVQSRSAEDRDQNLKEWYVLKGENKFGPFSYFELVRMLQEKSLYEFDYVWTASLSDWCRVSDCEEFSAQKIRSLHQTVKPGSEEIFFRRRHARANYGASVVVHNCKTVWKGTSLELSSGGAGLMIENSSLEPGQTLFLHFKVGDDVPPFNAICSVVSKHQAAANTNEVRYGVKFTNISRDVRHAIKNFTEKAA